MKNIAFIMISIMMFSCNNQSAEKLWEDAKQMRSENNLEESIINLESIIRNYPEHNLAAKAQFQKAEIYLNDIKDFEFAIDEFLKVIDRYPTNDVAKNSLFMIAYIYNNYLNSYSDSIDNYKLFMTKYPDDELIPSVLYELEDLLKIQDTIDSLNSVISNKK